MKKQELCLRCRSKDAIFTCLMCESFKFLCMQCDNYVHSLPSKKNHKKVEINDPENLSNQEIPQNNLHRKTNNFINVYTSEDPSSDNLERSLKDKIYFRNYSQPNDASNDTITRKKSNSYKQEKENDLDYVEMKSIDNPILYENTPYKTIDNLYDGSSLSANKFDFGSNTNMTSFSREYLNEVKNVFQKEKNELVYKNSSLQNSLDKLKYNFSEQVGYLNHELEELQKKHSYHLKSLEENFENKINTIISEKEDYISRLLCKINDLENINKELTSKVEENLKVIHDTKNSQTLKFNDLQIELKNKDIEIENLKTINERNIKYHNQDLGEEKNKIIYDYELKIESIINQFEESRNKMTGMLNEREKDIKDLIGKHNDEVKALMTQNQELKHEVECHKQNIIAIRTKRINVEKDIEELNEFVDRLKKDLKYQITEIKMLENQNKVIGKENEELKFHVSKLEKLVYGKMRPVPAKR